MITPATCRIPCLAALLFPAWVCSAADSTVDVANISPQDLDFSFTEPQRDKGTKFMVGGQNTTEQIKALPSLNGKSIADLERVMRPGESSTSGFLGKDEPLLDVLARDNDFVLATLRRTHQDLARPLLLLGYYARKHAVQDSQEVKLGDVRLRVRAQLWRGYQLSPFADGTKSNTDVVIENLSSGKTLKYSLLVPHMIERYGFYEGHGTSYRVDPQAIADVLEMHANK